MNSYGLISADIESQVKWLIASGYSSIVDRADIPQYPGVYIVFSQVENSWLYVGQSGSIRGRACNTEHPYIQAAKLGLQPILFVKEIEEPEYMYEEALMVGLLRPSWNFGQHPASEAMYERWKKYKNKREHKRALEANKHVPNHNQFKAEEARKRFLEVIATFDGSKFESTNKLFLEAKRTANRIHGVSFGPKTFYKYSEIWWNLLTDEAKAASRLKAPQDGSTSAA